jgi:hypothetical protein
MVDQRTKDILAKYGRKLEGEIKTDKKRALSNAGWAGRNGDNGFEGSYSKDFAKFKQDMVPSFSRYERMCKGLGNIIKIKLAEKDAVKVNKKIKEARLDVDAGQVAGLAIMSFLLVFFVSLLLSVALFLFTGVFPLLFMFLGIVASLFLFYYFYTSPERLGNKWRLMASSQMIPCILYTVVYMKHTSNLERAVRFASEHLDAPLGLDFKKVFWDVEVGRFSNIKESLDYYLETWRQHAPEFIESFNLIESSLFEPSEARRVEVLERSLQVILEGVYDKMLKFTHSVKAPLTNLYMLGIVLPTLGLALLPLASALLGGALKWYAVAVFFNLLVPFFVFYITNNIMLKRPGGYGENTNLELNPNYVKYKSKRPYGIAALICVPLLILGFLPFILRIPGLASSLGMQSDYSFSDLGFSGSLGAMKLFEFIETEAGVSGPMGLLALLLSLLIPLSLFLFFAISYKMRTKDLIKSRDLTRSLEKEFNNSLFKLGNRIGGGTPAEIAFGKVAESSTGLVTESFFKTVNSNIHALGMNLEKAIFDQRRGAIIYYPSALISTSMHILIESAKKGLKVAAASLMSISEYVKNIQKINERLKDLLADVSSDMKSNMTFLAPLLAGIVVGLGSMITLILSKLTGIINNIPAGGEVGFENIINFTDLFQLEGLIPPYFLQIIVGIYILEIVFILTKALVTVDAGQDQLKETYEIGNNIMKGGMLYLIVSFLSIVALSALAVVALAGIGV